MNGDTMKVLIVEDNSEVADIIRHQVLDAGHEVVGPAYDIISALGAIHREEIDCALLDVHLAMGVLVTPVAEVLEAREIPFVFITGYPLISGDQTSPLGRFSNRVVLTKPYARDALIRILQTMSNNRGLRLVPGVYQTDNHNHVVDDKP